MDSMPRSGAAAEMKSLVYCMTLGATVNSVLGTSVNSLDKWAIDFSRIWSMALSNDGQTPA